MVFLAVAKSHAAVQKIFEPTRAGQDRLMSSSPQDNEMLYPPAAKRVTISPGAAVQQAAAPAPADAAGGEPRDPLAELWATILQNDGRVMQGFQVLHERVLAIETLLGLGPASVENAAADPAASPPPTAAKPAAAPELPPQAMPSPPAAVATPQPALPPQPVQPVRDVRPVQVAPNAGGMNGLAAIVFPPDLARQPELAPHLQAILHGLMHDDPATVGLVGELLIFRSATIEKMPQVVKDVGEAWYRWRPDRAGGPDPMRDALIDWLHRRLELAGITHRVTLVHVGDRFDSKLHNAQGRGVEVKEVFGWLVLRAGGSVYTKASVAVA